MPSESTNVTVGTVWICFERQSTTTRIVLYPLDSGSSPMTSTEMICHLQSGTQFGDSFPTFFVGNDLVRLQVSHPRT